MSIKNNKTLLELDLLVHQYIIYLAHIQQSLTLPLADKLESFIAAEKLAVDIQALSAKVMSTEINAFNEKDIESFIGKQFGSVVQKMKREMNLYDSRLKIDERTFFSIKEAIQKLTCFGAEGASVRPDTMNRLLRYKKLLMDRGAQEKEEEIKRSLKQALQKEDQQFDAFKLKTFKDMLRGVNHRNEDFFFKTNLHIARNYLDGIQVMVHFDENAQGTYFVLDEKNDIRIRVQDGDFLADYSVKSTKAGDASSLYVIGMASYGPARLDFYIEESIPSSMINSYLNAFNLTPLIKACNECYTDFFSQKSSSDDPEREAKEKLDALFSGKIR